MVDRSTIICAIETFSVIGSLRSENEIQKLNRFLFKSMTQSLKDLSIGYVLISFHFSLLLMNQPAGFFPLQIIICINSTESHYTYR